MSGVRRASKRGAAALAAMGLSALLVAPALAEVESLAILTPEQGTDFGWNQQAVDAARAVGEELGLEVVVASRLGYGDIRPTLRELAAEGVDLLIAHASGYNTAAPEIAAETGVPVAIVDAPQAIEAGLVADYTLSGHEGAYLAGVLAARMTRSGTLGVVVSGEPPAWNSQSVGFAQGARATDREVELRYSVIGPAAYADAAGARRVTEAVIAAGADIIFGQGNGSTFGMLQAAETTDAADGGKVWFIDIIGDKSALGSEHLLSSVLWNLQPVYMAMVEDLNRGSFGTEPYHIKLADDSVQLLKTQEIPEDVWREVMDVRERIVSGEIQIQPVFDAEEVHGFISASAD